jgi:hypothetical protein
MEYKKICRECKEEKAVSEFHKDKTKKYGVTGICKPCSVITRRAYYLANTPQILEYQRRYAKFYIPRHTREIDSKLKNLCTKARKRINREFSLVPQDLHDLWTKQDGKCAYTGLPLVATANQYNTVSLDRIDSSKGYVVGNIQLVCAAVNKMKLDYDEKVYIQFCHYVSQHNKDKIYPIDLADTV